jgi:acetyltransferase-like isoleucine patch superfamily enzyme
VGKPGLYSARGKPAKSFFQFLPRIATRMHSLWLRNTWPFAKFGDKTSVHWSCEIDRSVCRSISLGDDIHLARHVWLNVVGDSDGAEPRILLGDRCKIGRRSTISSRNRIVLQEDVLLGPSVLIMDHNHEFANTEVPIHEQGVTEGGQIIVERGCWLGHGAVIVCSRGQLILGRNSVVGANAVVTKSFPPFSVMTGNPARIVKTYDQQSDNWIKPNERPGSDDCVGQNH